MSLLLARELEGRQPPVQEDYLSDTYAIPHESKANGCNTPSAILSRALDGSAKAMCIQQC